MNLTAVPAGSEVLTFVATTYGSVTLPVVDINAGRSAAEAMNAFLAQYAYFLHTNDPQEQRQVLDVMSLDTGVRAQVTAARTAFKTEHTGAVSMPVFWDTSQAPVVFTQTRTAKGVQVTLSGGTLYESVYDPPKIPRKLVWQDPHGRTIDNRTTISQFSVTFGPTTKSNLDTISPVTAYSLQ